MPAKVATALANLKYRLKKKRNNVNFLSRFVLEHLEDACPRFCDLTSQKWMRQRGIEPRSTAWKATMLTITPLTPLKTVGLFSIQIESFHLREVVTKALQQGIEP